MLPVNVPTQIISLNLNSLHNNDNDFHNNWQTNAENMLWWWIGGGANMIFAECHSQIGSHGVQKD